MEEKAMRSFIKVLWCLVLVFLSMCGCGDSCDEQVKRAEDDCELRIGTLLRQKEISDQCLKREAAAAVPKEPVELPPCDKDMIDLGCMDAACPYDPETEFPGKKLTDAEVLQFSWHHVEYDVRECRSELEDALEREGEIDGGCSGWVQYTHDDVEAKLECIRNEYHAVNKRVLTFASALPMNFAAWVNTEGYFGFAPRLKAVQIYLDSLMDVEGVGGIEKSGLTPTELGTGFQKAFAEAVAFLEQYRKKGDEKMVDEITANLCQIVSLDEHPYSMYPHEPVRGKTRVQMEDELKCPKAELPKVEQQKAPSGGGDAHGLTPPNYD